MVKECRTCAYYDPLEDEEDPEAGWCMFVNTILWPFWLQPQVPTIRKFRGDDVEATDGANCAAYQSNK